MADKDHDPFTDRALAHPRAQELLVEDFFWDRADKDGPFGSAAGRDAYFEFRNWRKANPRAPLVDCISWILDGRLSKYSAKLCTDTQIQADMAKPDQAFMADAFDMFTLDATILATGLGQLLDEGRVDPSAKPFLNVALTRQQHPAVVTSEHRATVLEALQRALKQA